MKLLALPLGALLTLTATASLAATPWLPAPGEVQGSIAYIHQSADKFYLGSQKSDLPAALKLDSFVADLSYGLRDSVMLYGELGEAKSSFPPAGKNDSGLTDTRLGIAWRLVDEFVNPSSWVPSVTLRGAAIIRGDYSTGRIDAIGDGGSGYEVSVSAGRLLTPQLSLSGEIGYRVRANKVPDDTFLNLRAGWAFSHGLSVALDYQYTDAHSSLDIGGPGFTPARFQQIDADRSLLSGSVNWAVLPHLSVGTFYGRVLGSRNVAVSDVYGVSIGTSY